MIECIYKIKNWQPTVSITYKITKKDWERAKSLKKDLVRELQALCIRIKHDNLLKTGSKSRQIFFENMFSTKISKKWTS